MLDACRICNARTVHFARARILNKYDINYQRCSDCEFIQTEKPYWLDEAYNQVIIASDVGLVSRNLKMSAIASRVLRVLFPTATTGTDYGGGYGLFTRLMRDKGHQFFHDDPHSENLFAKDFQTQQGTQYDLLTAFEVWEHLENPHADLQKMDQTAHHWLVSTLLLPDPPPKPDQWWYYVLEGGQHIALWSKRAMQAVASRYHRQLISTNRGIHLFSGERVNPTLASLILRGRGGILFDRLNQKKSLMHQDHELAQEKTRLTQ